MEFEITVDDDQMDSDEYDTEWSSIEILLYTYNDDDDDDNDVGKGQEEKAAGAAAGVQNHGMRRRQRQLSARIHRRAYLTQNPGGTTRKPYGQRKP